MHLESVNPATGVVVGEVPVTDCERIPELIANAKAAGIGWRRLTPTQRAVCLRKIKPLFLERADELTALLTQEMGKPLREASGEVNGIPNGLDALLDEMVEAFSVVEVKDGRCRTSWVRNGFGVCAAITPWNFPISMPHWLCLPALMAGNTVILKPSEHTPLIAQKYAEILQSVLPPNVLQVVHGDGAQGAALVNADVDLIAFTGSAETGKRILEAASADLKRVLLELGGKDPLVVLADADITRAAKFAARNSFRNAGQVCVSTERIYVHRDIEEAFVNALVTETATLTVGDGALPNTRIGPMIHRQQKDKVLAQLQQAVAAGAVIATPPPREDSSNFLDPVVLTGVNHDMIVMREETFGPVAGVVSFGDTEEAIRLANDTPFGLGAIVFGDAEAEYVASRIDAGMVGINQGLFGAGSTPWVGAKQSGYGFHHSIEGHRQFAQLRVISRPER